MVLNNNLKMNRNKYIVYPLLLLVLTACGGRKIKPESLTSSTYDYVSYEDGEIIVPFEVQGGVRIVQVRVNGCAEFPMIFDTGCSDVSISQLELATLIKHGYISDSDFRGTSHSQIADGSLVENMCVNIKKLEIGSYVCYNVVASVSPNLEAPLLLGNAALRNVQSFSIDDDQRVIRFNVGW